jgi:hypothetical protein
LTSFTFIEKCALPEEQKYAYLHVDGTFDDWVLLIKLKDQEAQGFRNHIRILTPVAAFS